MDFVLNADRPIKSYWIKFRGLLDCASDSIFQSAILTYNNRNSLPDSTINYENSGPDVDGMVTLLIN